MLASGTVIAWGAFANVSSSDKPGGPPLAWLEIAYPVFFLRPRATYEHPDAQHPQHIRKLS